MGQFEGKTAVVTGGSSGIGLATAERLAAEGAHVFVTGRRETELQKAVAAIGNATAVAGDVSVAADVDRLYERVRERGNGLDVLFANAGINHLARLDELTEEDHDRIFDINVKGTFLTVQKALPLLNDGASVILTASTSAESGTERFGAYGASKAAVRAYGRTWANELVGRGIRINVISPGPADTPLFDLFGERAEEMKAAIGAALPAKRIADPGEIAAAVLFLASQESSFVYGANLYVDGGMNQI
ncbi:SDR family NAD(P)-dependent oxidoreductase [Pseudonocardia cypriaca]|uniref:NAD(P)-dependent dehydrogenase (Short-subunit alcohol dehydrogenase family) n=1 Tax=Pseudonocardia cypriaca TaxID=882449 RepID=A0A543GC63_9PSEU|nr:glucose 1-dehydrogenase [Pseudonocardia cypriaca]TQM43661.1 NAD(P)-dependent dehydrogenase (short-subunit alcohol dehydrogenase family) [Pseudonocardia cypriaca]